MIYLELIFEFFKAGLFSVGGGLATLPFLYDMSERMGWFSRADLADMIAVSQSTPGPIGINMATYAGYNCAGILGSILATLALITPSIIIILIIAKFLKKFRENKYVEYTFYGLRPASTALIAAAGFEVVKLSLLNLDKYNITKNLIDIINIKAIILAVVLYIAIEKFKKHPVVYIAISAVVGIVLKLGV